MTGTVFTIPTLQTDRLALRAPAMRDFDAYADFCASGRASFVGGPYDRAAAFRSFCALAGDWVLRGYGRWVIADKGTDAALGVTGIYHPDDWPGPEISWSVFAPAEGRSIAHEAALAVRAYAYETLKWTGIISLVMADNDRSLALARRLGCTQDGVFSHAVHGDMPILRHPARGATT